ncbi:hypothetical protein FZO89_10895 [Luteimonas viscosa]|uniref:TonB family C-terminal domain-containing protein n=1 Tax=Luteimonas viscosa TaxID=1132694 RepID=A0A5D4XRN3_9GAMM|nr:hypothetical protein [Luteimonas viscosa]TYT26724.1 hypothetical protein FZO89_10895 [Luteimonas viscosa]
MKAKTCSAVLAVLVLPAAWSAAWAGDDAYLEFLWATPPKSALARAEAYGFTLEPAQDHRVCVAALTDWREEDVLTIEVVDASGKLVNRQVHEDFRGSKRCYKAQLGTTGTAGEWTFNVYISETLAGAKTIEVARTLKDAPFYAQGSRPYVLGRPNYDTKIPASEYIGRLVWVMQVDAAGSVSAVEMESAEGAGNRMRERAIAAGLLTKFPPDPARSAHPLKIRQEYNLSTQ